MKTDPLRQPGELVDNPFYREGHLINAVGEQSVSPLFKQYMRGYVACHFHLATTVGKSSHSHDLCADFQAWPGSAEEGDFLRASTLEGSSFKVEYSGSNEEWCEHPVFISVGEVSEGAKGTISVPSLVRLRSVDDCPARTRDFAESFPLLGEPLASILNRELNSAGFPSRFGYSDVVAMQLPEKMVESAAQVVNHVSYEDAHPKPPLLWDCCDPKDVVTRSRVTLSPDLDLISLALGDGADYGYESICMLLRPIDFGPTSTKIDGHSRL